MLLNIVYFAWRRGNIYNATSQQKQSNQINILWWNKENAYDSQTIRAKDIQNLSQGGSSKRQPTNESLKSVAYAAVRSKAVVLLLLTFCLLLLPLWKSVIVLCSIVRYFMSILVLQSSWWGRDSWLLCLICLTGVSWWLGGSSSRCNGVVCGLWLWYFLIILTYYFCHWVWGTTIRLGLNIFLSQIDTYIYNNYKHYK